MILTERDIEIIQFVNEFSFCNIIQIQARFQIRKTWAYDIMKKLADAKLVKHHRLLHARHGVYVASKEGAKYTHLPPIDHIVIGQYYHQLTITNVFIKLQKQYPNSTWISERQLKHDKFYDGLGKSGHTSDGILLLDNQRISIEIEMSVKGRNRIEKILREYGADLSVKEVWYYCSKSVKNTVTSVAAKMPFIKVFSLEEFLA
jgi:hypothetical protein